MNFESNYNAKQAKRDAARAKQEEENKAKQKGESMIRIDDLKEDPDTIQEQMPNENVDNIKLYPILKEAYELLEKIENIEK